MQDKSQELFEKNITAFLSNSGKSKSLIDQNRVSEKKSTAESVESIQWWIDQTTYPRAVALPNQLPSTEQRLSEFRADATRLSQLSLKEYIDLHVDFHLIKGLVQLSDLKKEINFPLEDNATVVNSGNINTLFCLGTGDGSVIAELISSLDPLNITVLVTSWDDVASSFYKIDWTELSARYSSAKERSLTIKKIDSRDQLVANFLAYGTASLEHSYVYVSSVADDDLAEYSVAIKSKEIENSYHYLGYSVDEINMVISSADTLETNPKIFSHPVSALSLNSIVCGSGPSLDEELELIKSLQDTHVIIAGGSNYKTLAMAGIRVDYLVLVERAFVTYDDYKEAYDLVGRTNTRVLMSSTCTSLLSKLFDEIAVYYRPALTPVSLFAQTPSEVLHFEGPESVNCAFAFALTISSQIALFGVDLGSATKSKNRSANAAGPSPRVWSDQVKGNFQENVWTNRNQIDSRMVIEAAIKNHVRPLKVFNCSNGQFISGAVPLKSSEYKKRFDSEKHDKYYPFTGLDQWWDELPQAPNQFGKACIRAGEPRSHTYNLARSLESVINDPSLHFCTTMTNEIDILMDLNVSQYAQFPRRIMRSSVLKILVNAIRQHHVIAKQSAKIVEYEKGARSILLEMIHLLESQIYELCDYIEQKQ